MLTMSMSPSSLSDLRRQTAQSDYDDEPSPPYSLEDPLSVGMIDSAPATLMLWAEKALQALPTSSTVHQWSLWSVNGKRRTAGASQPLVQLGPIILCVIEDWHISTAYLLKVRSTNTITVFRSTSGPSSTSSSSARKFANHSLRRTGTALYDIPRSAQGPQSFVRLDSKTRDNLFSEPSSRLELRKSQNHRNSNVWELYFHCNYGFESLVEVPAPDSQLTLSFDTSSTWRDRGGRAVAKERKTGLYQNYQGLRKIPRIDISGGLDQRFMELLVACWAAKVYMQSS